MKFTVPAFLEKLGYSPIGQDANGEPSSPTGLYMRPALNSKRWRVVLVTALLLILLSAGVFFHDHISLPDYTLPKISGSSSKTETSSAAAVAGGVGGGGGGGSSHGGISTNAEILEAVAPSVDWSQFAYVQYVTTLPYLCNSVMLFAILDRLNCRADRLMMYPQQWNPDGNADETSRLLKIARDKYKVKLQPIHVQSKKFSDPTWAESYTKFLAMNQTAYTRALSLDSDSTVLQCMDELFLLPPSPVAMPRAYWDWKDDKPQLSSQLLLVEPNATEFDRVMRYMESAPRGAYDMDILHQMFFASAMVLPHKDYDLLTGEFKHGKDGHAKYLGSPEAVWDPRRVINEAKFLHFSDWPIPKPWFKTTDDQLRTNGAQCSSDGDCTEKDMWYGFYEDFRQRRKEVCDMDVV